MMDYDIIMQTMMLFCAMFKIYLLGICMCIIASHRACGTIG